MVDLSMLLFVPWLQSPTVVVLVWRREWNRFSFCEMAEHLPLCIVSGHVLELVVKDLPLHPGITLKTVRLTEMTQQLALATI